LSDSKQNDLKTYGEQQKNGLKVLFKTRNFFSKLPITYLTMSEEMEVIDSGNMKVLSEFRCEDETSGNPVAFRIGVLGNDFIIATLAMREDKKDTNVIPSDEETDAEFDELFSDEYETEAERNAARMEMREHTKKSYENSIRRGWWDGDILFEKSNLRAVNNALSDVLAGKLVESGERAFEIKQGKDSLYIGAISNWGHNMSAPEEKVTFQSLRDVELDGVEIGMSPLRLNVSAAKKLNEEIGKIIESGNF